MLEGRVVVEKGAFRLDASLRVEGGQTLAVVGPNGSGKSTLLRALMGLEPLQEGSLRCEGELWEGEGTRLPPRERAAALLFQSLSLFPALSALDNVAFGLVARGATRREARARARAALDELSAGELADRRVTTLSGGQAQLVALARALVVRPRVLLLDEPMAALDVERRAQVRSALRAALERHEGVAVLVTHDPVDALTLGQRVLVLEGGRVGQEGTADDIVRRPSCAFAARLVGTNLVHGQVRGGRFEVGRLSLPAVGDEGPAAAIVPPRQVLLGVEGGVSARVRRVQLSQAGARVLVALPPELWAELDLERWLALGLGEGDEVSVRVQEDPVVLVDAARGAVVASEP